MSYNALQYQNILIVDKITDGSQATKYIYVISINCKANVMLTRMHSSMMRTVCCSGRWGGCLYQCMLGYTSPAHAGIHTSSPVHVGIHTPPVQCMLGYTLTRAQCMLGYTPLPSACWDTHLPCQVHTHPLPSACWDTHPLPSACWDTPPNLP